MRAPKHGLGPESSVEIDWRAELPKLQRHAFEAYTNDLEGSYLMFSISLDEAIRLHESSWLSKSFQVVALTSELCARLSTSMESMLRSLAEHRSEHELNLTVAPLNPSYFRNDRSRFLALKSLIWHALLTRKSQFRNKTRSLRPIVAYATRRFCTTAETLAIEGIVADSSDSWAVLEQAHFDLNTCLRELFVLLKSFLRVLPDDELRVFQENVSRGILSLLAPRRVNAKAAGR